MQEKARNAWFRANSYFLAMTALPSSIGYAVTYLPVSSTRLAIFS